MSAHEAEGADFPPPSPTPAEEDSAVMNRAQRAEGREEGSAVVNRAQRAEGRNVGEIVPARAAPQDAWRAAVQGRATSHPRLLPEVALDPGRRAAQGALLFARPGLASGSPSALALLEPASIRLARAPCLGELTRLSALRVVGSELYGDVTREGAEAFVDAACALLEAGRAECVLFDDLAADSPLAAPIAAARARGRVGLAPRGPRQPHWYVRFPAPASAYWRALPGKARYKLRRKARGFSHRLVAVTRPEHVADFLAKARWVSERSWQGRRFGLRVTGSREEIREAARLAEAGALRSYLLEAEDGSPVAFVLGSQWGGLFRHEETAYDTAWAELSPGIVLLFRLLEDLTERDPPRLLDFGAGDAEYKRSFGNACAESGPVALIPRAGRPRRAAAVARAWQRADRGARDALRRAGIYDKARRLYRGRR